MSTSNVNQRIEYAQWRAAPVRKRPRHLENASRFFGKISIEKRDPFRFISDSFSFAMANRNLVLAMSLLDDFENKRKTDLIFPQPAPQFPSSNQCLIWLGFTVFYRVLLTFNRFYWVLLGFTRFFWILLGFTRFHWVLPGLTGFYIEFYTFRALANVFYWVLPGFTGFYWVLLGFTGFYRVWLGFTLGLTLSEL